MVLGDGNCMFRSLAKQLSGDSDRHGQLRDKLCEFISLNGKVLKGGSLMELGLKSTCNPSANPAYLELSWNSKAASTMFNLDIYVATNSLLRNNHYIWTKILPITPFHHSFSVTENGPVSLIQKGSVGWKFATKTAVTMTA